VKINTDTSLPVKNESTVFKRITITLLLAAIATTPINNKNHRYF